MEHAPAAESSPSHRRRVLLGAGLLVLLAAAALAVDVARQSSTAEALVWAEPAALTRPADRPTLIRFTADWCPPCQAMKRDIFSQPDLAADLTTRYRAVSVDLTDPGPDEQDLATRHGVSSIPTFVVMTPDGVETGRMVGGSDAAGFAAFLDRHAAP